MRNAVFAMVAFAALPAAAGEGMELSIRSQVQAAAASVAAAPARSVDGPFRARRDPLPEMSLREELARRAPPSRCEHAVDFCYDLAEGRVVYRPARALLPEFEGLRPESVSLRRDRILFRYSFR